ncbi:MAG: hypothetical protein K9W44_11720 [Candidatus Lokiarchaeota archaeon]|nr:hypothetical protein [Candidatus Harpocratesius repetitus]
MHYSPILSKETLEKVRITLFKNARNLEKNFFSFLFENGSPELVLEEITRYQNRDGGFGMGIEPDFHLPQSTSMATSVGLRLLHELKYEINQKMRNGGTLISNDLFTKIENQIDQKIALALHHLITSFDINRRGWYAVRHEINDFPHAPWWHWDELTRMTVIDKSWANPTAELTGYFYHYRNLLPEKQYQEFIEATTKFVIKYFSEKKVFTSEHEIYCAIRLYWLVDESYQKILLSSLKTAVNSLIETDLAKWKDYVPKPLDFVNHPDKNPFEIPIELLNKNIKWYIEKLKKNTQIEPSWQWGQYDTFWNTAKQNWSGILTLNTLRVLRNFNCLEF